MSGANGVTATGIPFTPVMGFEQADRQIVQDLELLTTGIVESSTKSMDEMQLAEFGKTAHADWTMTSLRLTFAGLRRVGIINENTDMKQLTTAIQEIAAESIEGEQ